MVYIKCYSSGDIKPQFIDPPGYQIVKLYKCNKNAIEEEHGL